MKKIIVFLLCLTMGTSLVFAQDIERNIKERLTDYFAKYTATAKISTPKLNSFDIDYDRRTIQIYASESFAYQPFLPETVETIYNQMKELLPGPVNYYQITIYADGKPIEELVPNLYRSKKKDKERMALNTEYKGAPWVKTLPAPMRYPEDCRTGILPSGKVTVIIIRMTKANGDGSAPDYSAPQKICSLNPSFFHTSFRCWKMPVPLCILLANGTHKRMKSLLTTILRMLPFIWK